MPEFEQLSLTANFVIFILAAATVWQAGTRISGYASVISEETGISNAVMGMLLLGGVTSLPELAVTASAALRDNVELAVNNIFGGVAMQVVVLVLADFLIGRRALTAVIPESVVILQGSLMMLMLAIAAAAMVAGDVAFFGIGLWSWVLLLLYVLCIWILSRDPGRRPWIAARAGRIDRELLKDKNQQASAKSTTKGDHDLTAAVFKAMLVAAIILLAGYLVTRTGEAISSLTGLGSSFAGFVLIAISTSLPEVSTVFAATRLGLYTMAISDIFGTNLFDIALLFLIDALAGGGAALDRVGAFSIFGAILGIVVTAMFVAGLAERRDQSIFRLGLDSIGVLSAYAIGLVILFSLR